MKLLTITALFIAGALAVPASSYPPPPPPDYGGDNGGDNGGYSPTPSSSSSYVPPTPTPPPPPPPPSYDDGDDYEPPTDGDGDSSDGGDDGDDSGDSGDGGDGERSGSNICPHTLYGLAQCCSLSVLGLVNIGCGAPSKVPRDKEDFEQLCSAKGKQATCCTLGVANLGLVCSYED
ncbi:fungal hydrophobin-domain-containing protein [Trichoderma sp. SZMC 28011]